MSAGPEDVDQSAPIRDWTKKQVAPARAGIEAPGAMTTWRAAP
jgi:hypothetical protein